MEKNEQSIPKPSQQGLTEEEIRNLVDSMLQNYQNSIRILSGKLFVNSIQLTDFSATPTTGSYQRGTLISVLGELYICTVSGTPGTWVQVGLQT